ncbi:RNase H domain-containing protein [Trichonephila clavipes]|nr:RNase H domain-containing protein [Trichonephila clavipes]
MTLRQASQDLEELCHYSHTQASRNFKKWSDTPRLKRSSILQQDQEIRNNINFQNDSLGISKEPSHTQHIHPQAKVNLNLVQLCTKKEPVSVIKEKGDHIIEEFTIQTETLVIPYTNGSSDSNLDGGGAGVFYIFQHREHEYHKIQVGKIASNYTCELFAVKSPLEIFLSKSFQESNGIIIFTDPRSALQAIQKGKSEIRSKIITRRRLCTLQ